jgi:uncharacterized protein
MSPGPADQVNAKELSARAAVVERSLNLPSLERVREAGGLPGTRIDAQLRFGSFEGRTTVDVHVQGEAVLACQRCLAPCEYALDEAAQLMLVADDAQDVPGGYEPVVVVPEHVSLSALIEEQVLLALPLVPMHAEDDAQCRARVAGEATRENTSSAATPVVEATAEKQTPFANLRELLGEKPTRGPASGE